MPGSFDLTGEAACPYATIVLFHYCRSPPNSVTCPNLDVDLSSWGGYGFHCCGYSGGSVSSFSTAPSSLHRFAAGAGHRVVFLDRLALSRIAEETAQRERDQGQ